MFASFFRQMEMMKKKRGKHFKQESLEKGGKKRGISVSPFLQRREFGRKEAEEKRSKTRQFDRTGGRAGALKLPLSKLG